MCMGGQQHVSELLKFQTNSSKKVAALCNIAELELLD